MKRIYVGLCLLLGMSTEAGWAQKARMNLLLNNQDLSYEVRYEDQLVISPSPLGLNVDNQWLGKDVTFKPATNTTQDGIKTYVVQRQGQTMFHVELQEFDDGVAFRYRIPAKGPKCIYGEATSRLLFLPRHAPGTPAVRSNTVGSKLIKSVKQIN